MIRTLEEAIAHAKEVAENWKSQLVNCVSEEGRNKCIECAKEHEKLAEWLTELKQRREQEKPQGDCEKCDYRKFIEKFVDSVVEVMNKHGITSVEQLSEMLKGGEEQ